MRSPHYTLKSSSVYFSFLVLLETYSYLFEAEQFIEMLICLFLSKNSPTVLLKKNGTLFCFVSLEPDPLKSYRDTQSPREAAARRGTIPQEWETSTALIPLPASTQGGSETLRKPLDLRYLGSRPHRFPALSTVLDHKGPWEIHQQDPVRPGAQLLDASP